MLDYATQVQELEKIDKLSPRPIVTREPPPLVRDPSAKCLVCNRKPASLCGACKSVSYCGVEHQQRDAKYHDRVCEVLHQIAEDRAIEPGDVVDDPWSLPPGARRRRLTDRASRSRTLSFVIETLGLSSEANVHVMAASQRELEVDDWPTRVTLIGPELPNKAGQRAAYSRALWSSIGTPELIIAYDAGLLMYPTWKATILDIRGSGVPFAITSYRDWEAEAEARLLTAVRAECLLAPRKNPFASESARRSATIANDVSYDNAFLSIWS